MNKQPPIIVRIGSAGRFLSYDGKVFNLTNASLAALSSVADDICQIRGIK